MRSCARDVPSEQRYGQSAVGGCCWVVGRVSGPPPPPLLLRRSRCWPSPRRRSRRATSSWDRPRRRVASRDRKSTRLNSSHRCISYAVFCLKKKKKHNKETYKKHLTYEIHR